MKKHEKSLISVLLLIFLLVFSACSGNDTKETDTSREIKDNINTAKEENETNDETEDELPREETLYFGGLQWGGN